MGTARGIFHFDSQFRIVPYRLPQRRNFAFPRGSPADVIDSRGLVWHRVPSISLVTFPEDSDDWISMSRTRGFHLASEELARNLRWTWISSSPLSRHRLVSNGETFADLFQYRRTIRQGRRVKWNRVESTRYLRRRRGIEIARGRRYFVCRSEKRLVFFLNQRSLTNDAKRRTS